MLQQSDFKLNGRRVNADASVSKDARVMWAYPAVLQMNDRELGHGVGVYAYV
jgi:hypothetical protein